MNKEKIKNNLESLKEDFHHFYCAVINNRMYYFPILFCMTIAYGFDLFNRTVSMDDLAYDYFNGSGNGFIAGLRWGVKANILVKTSEFTPFISKFASFVFMIIGAVLLSFIFYVANNKKEYIIPYTLLSCAITTFPLYNEIYSFFSCYADPIGLTLACLSIIIQLYFPKKVLMFVISGIIVSPLLGGVEPLAFLYVTLVLIVLFFQHINKKNEKYFWLIEGLYYTIPLFIGLALKYVIGYFLLFINNLEYAAVGSYGTKWFTRDISIGIKEILYNGFHYFIRGLSYFPISEFVIALFIFIAVLIKKVVIKDNDSFIIGILIIISLFFLSYIEGEQLHYRNAWTINLFYSFVVYVISNQLVMNINDNKHRKVSVIIIVLMFFVMIRQSIYFHELMALNNQRSENEAYVARAIGYKIYSEFDKDKTVIFCGEYQLGNFIENQITVKEDSIAGKVENWIRSITNHPLERLYPEFVDTNINSYFNTQKDAFDGQIMIKRYLSYYGYDINVLENLSRKEEEKLKGYYEGVAKKENMKPYEVKDMGEYILVYLGPTIDGINQ